MLRFLLPILLLTASQAAAETVRLHCPSPWLNDPEMSQDWAIDLDENSAELLRAGSTYEPVGKHRIVEISETRIRIQQTDVPENFWNLDRHTLHMQADYTALHGVGTVGRDCHIVERKI